ncbi:MAG: aspartyl-tRNA(Asn)/glutamyl-tRNA(Gln) amidotransferase subunit [Acetobacteraceae bacterium]|nr:aspartyl-tRNA(Asn)/glutamyl-tRNA(Gln) amidotransferase subunit [Acetobacteraceae bacterium]MEA2769879.1 aspartyl-tRNA(Asn)/glutamyl-tRNA(Gln) amidotransferase subunit [Acetobacteraceae bacterium]
MTSPAFLPVHTLAAEIAARRLSPVDLIDVYLTRIERLEPKLQAFVSVNAANARLAAEAADKAIRSGHAVGPLHGIPIAIKDLVEIEGEVAMGGSAAWRNRVAQRTASLHRRLMAAGMINLGKTHTVEFAYGGWGTNQHLGTPWNPWDAAVHRTPGGSSSGTGVAVSARMAPWGIGTDTGGSVRIPAAWNGITGLKTTIGRISAYGVLPLSSTLDTPGPMTRDIEDAALLLAVLQGADPNDPHTMSVRDTDPLRDLRRGVKGLRLGRLPVAERAGVDAEVLAAYDLSVDALAGLGAEIVDVTLPDRFGDLGGVVGRIISAEIYAAISGLADDNVQPLDQDVRPRVRAGAAISSKDYLAALAGRDRMKIIFNDAIAGVDALLTPTTVTAAVPIASIDQNTAPAVFTRWVNFYDLCAAAVPNGFTASGLPTSLQIVCRGFEEALALRIGWAYQAAHDWHMRAPALAS